MQALPHSVPLTPLQATVNTCLCLRLLEIHSQVWLSLLCGHCSFFPGSWCTQGFVLYPLRICFPSPVLSSVIKSTGLLSQILWEFSIPLPDPQVGKSVVGPRTFLTVQEFLCYNYSAVCTSSAQCFYGGTNGRLLQEGLCHMLCVPGLLQPEPLALQ